MKTENKLLNKYLFPYYMYATLSVGIATGTVVLGYKQVQENKEFAQKNPDIQPENSLDLLYVLLLVGCICYSYFGFHIVPAQARKKTNALACTYIYDMLQKYPELKSYESALSDPDQLEQIIALVCNGLDEKTQKQIIQISKKYNNIDAKDRSEETDKITEIDKQILDIAKNYAAQNPNYMATIRVALIKKHNAYVMNQQHTK